MVHLERFETWVFVKVSFFFYSTQTFHILLFIELLFIYKGFQIFFFFKASEKGKSSRLDNCWPDLFLCQINKKKIFLKKNLGRLDILFKLDTV